MSDFFSRIGNLIKGAAENFVKGLEEDNPEAVIQAALETQTRRVGELSGHVSSLTRRLEAQRTELGRLQIELGTLSAQAATIAGKDDAKALELLELKTRAQEKCDTLEKEIVENEGRLVDSTEALTRTKAELEKLKRDKDQMLVDYHSLQQKNELAAAEQGVATSAAFQAVQNVREQLGKAEGVLKQAADDKTLRRQKALAELEALKARQASGGPTATSVEPVQRTLDAPGEAPTPTAAESATSSASVDDEEPVPRRTL